VIGDSTFLHMGMQGLLDIVYNRGNVTVLLLDNRAVGMTGGQDESRHRPRHQRRRGAARRLRPSWCEALGVKKERIHVLDPYQLPVLFKTMRDEIKIPEVSVIITDQPCVLIDDYNKQTQPYEVIDDKCTGCANCVDVGCPAIHVTRREKARSSPRARKSSYSSCASRPRPAPAAPCVSSPVRRMRSSMPTCTQQARAASCTSRSKEATMSDSSVTNIARRAASAARG
jgi:TPP-dependent indolepyruvate ferredoxin oxidoreductase alpha subunit